MSIIYFDTETTGLHNAQICQLAYIIEDDNNLTAKNFFFTVDSMNIVAQSIHGFSIEQLKELSNGEKFSDRIDEINKDFSNAGLLIAHNIGFDLKMMKNEFERLGVDFVYNNILCTMKTMTTYCKLPKNIGRGYKQPKLIELVDLYVNNKIDIRVLLKKLYNINSSFHDARYDTVAMYLAFTNAQNQRKELKEKVWDLA